MGDKQKQKPISLEDFQNQDPNKEIHEPPKTSKPKGDKK